MFLCCKRGLFHSRPGRKLSAVACGRLGLSCEGIFHGLRVIAFGATPVACRHGRAVRPFLRKEFFTTSGLSPSAPRRSHIATGGRLFLRVGFERPAPAAQLSAVACGRAVRPFLRKEFFTTSGLSPSAPRQSHVATIGRLFLRVGFEQPAPAAQLSAVACGRFGLSCGRNFSRPPGYRLRRRASRMSPRSGGFSYGWDLSSPLENIVVLGAEFLRARRSLFSPLSRSLPPPPTAVALQAHDLLRRPLGSLRTIKTKNNKGRPDGAPLVVFVSRR